MILFCFSLYFFIYLQARAAKEAEIQNILRSAVHQPKLSNSSTSSLPRPNLNAALQQAAQLVAPTLMFASQMQQQQAQQSSPKRSFATSTSRNASSTSFASSAEMTANDKLSGSSAPLDLSSQPPSAKRFKSNPSPHEDLTQIPIKESYASITKSPASPPLSDDKNSIIVASSTTAENSISKVGSSSSPHSSSALASTVSAIQCQAQSEEINSWTVDDVCSFVASIDICAEYVKVSEDVYVFNIFFL